VRKLPFAVEPAQRVAWECQLRHLRVLAAETLRVVTRRERYAEIFAHDQDLDLFSLSSLSGAVF
jgi:hypothetical protein